MLEIRTEQMKAFQLAGIRMFEDRMVAHLEDFAPSHFKILEEADIRKAIRFGMARAQDHGFTTERNLRLYIEKIFMLGSGFDSDPQFPWAAEILGDHTSLSDDRRMDRLSDTAWDYVNHVIPDYSEGEGNGKCGRLIDQLRKIRCEPDDVLAPGAVAQFSEDVAFRLGWVFPSKSSYVGEPCIERLIARAIRSANSYGITTQRGVLVFVVMMFVLGSGFDDDPLVPWASVTLNDPDITGESQRVERLFAGAVACLKRWWA